MHGAADALQLDCVDVRERESAGRTTSDGPVHGLAHEDLTRARVFGHPRCESDRLPVGSPDGTMTGPGLGHDPPSLVSAIYRSRRARPSKRALPGQPQVAPRGLGTA